MEFIVQVTVELPDSAVSFIGADSIVSGLSEKVEDALNTALPDWQGLFTVEAGTPESDGDEIVSATPEWDKPKGVSGLTDRQVARAVHTKGAVIRAEAPKGNGTGKTGRPATLHEYEAADGEPVRAAGPRSIESLRSQGIDVWKVGERPAPAPKNTGERVAVVKRGAPVMKVRSK